MNKKRIQKTLTTKTSALILVALAVIGTVALATAIGHSTDANANKTSVTAFHDQMRKLWEDHITWTRLVIISVLNGLSDTSSTVTRLLQNQVDIGNAIKPFYGDAAGNQLVSLLHDHITIAAEILTDAKNGDGSALNDAINRWYANAHDIAVFLTNANPDHWGLAMTEMMIKTHLDLTLNEAVTYLKADYNGSVTAYEEVHLQILQMADMLSSGLIAQFPQDFTGQK